jgi:mono/diheme cytochrome c family protein
MFRSPGVKPAAPLWTSADWGEVDHSATKKTRGVRQLKIFSMATMSLAICLCHGAALAQDAEAARAGEQVFETNCAPCHGERMSNPNGIFDLTQLRPQDRPRFDKALANGKGQMPSWAGVLSPDEMDQVWAYIQSVGG